MSPAFKTSNLSFALKGVYLTLVASPRTAAAIALQTSTSIPVHFPDASALENPGTPCDTPQFREPRFTTFSLV